MKKPVHILYVPGLGDYYDPLRHFCLSFWRVFGITAELVPMSWSDGNAYKEKEQRIEEAVKRARGKRVVLIGESAGGSMALNAYAKNPEAFYKAMTICGKNTQPHKVAPFLYRKNPAFKTSMYLTEASIHTLTNPQRQAFISIHPLVDHVVPIQETVIPDCRQVRVWSVGHFLTIAFLLTVGSFIVIRLARQPHRKQRREVG